MKNKKYLFLLMSIVLFLAMPITAFSAITVTAGTPLSGEVDDVILVPINVSNLTGEGVSSFDMELYYDKTKLSVTGYVSEGTLSSQLSSIGLANRSYGKYLGGYGTSSLTGEGILVYVQVKLLVEGSQTIEIKDFYFNSTEYTVNDVNITVGLTDVILPTQEVIKNESSLIPIMIEDVSSDNVTGYEFTFSYDTNMVEITNLSKTGTLSENWTVSSTIENGECIVAAFNNTALGSGTTLINLEVTAKSVGETDLTWSNFTFNEGTPVAGKINGTLTVISLNEPPTIISAPEDSVTVYKLSKYSHHFLASDPDVDNVSLTWSYEITNGSAPDSISLSQEIDGELVIIPSLENVGNVFSIKATVADDNSETADTTIVFTVSGENRAPVWTVALLDTSVDESETLTIDFGAIGTDPDLDEVTYSFSLTKNTEAIENSGSIDSTTGVYTWTPTFLQSGEYNLAVTISDGELEAVDNITITVNNINQIPEITAAPEQSNILYEGTKYSFTFVATDADTDNENLVWSKEIIIGSDVDSISFNDGELVIIPGYEDAGKSFAYKFTVTDDYAGIADTTIMFMVSASNRNPEWTTRIEDQTVDEDSLLLIDFSGNVNDPDGDVLFFLKTVLNSEGQVTENTGAITTEGIYTWTPDYTQAGTYTLIVSASDGTGASSDTVGVTVNNINRAPEWKDDITFDELYENSPITVNFSTIVEDADNDILTYVATITTSEGDIVEIGGIINESTGELNWTPGFETAGVYNLKIDVSDGTDTISKEWTLTIINVNQLPEITSVPQDTVELESNLAYTFQCEATDADFDNTSLNWSFEVVEGVIADSISIIDGQLYIMPNDDDQGHVFSLNLIVADDYSDVADSVVVFKVKEITAIDGLSAVPTVFALNQNYPNPFNPTTNIKYQIASASSVKITIYDLMGNQIRSLVNEKQDAGYKSVVWDSRNDMGMKVSSGIYIYQMQTDKFQDTKKMMFLK